MKSCTFAHLKTMTGEMSNPHVGLILHNNKSEIGIRSGTGINQAVPFREVEHVCNNLAQMPGCTRVEVEMNSVNTDTGAFELFAAAYGADNKVFDRRAIKPPSNPSAAKQPAEAGQQL